MLSGDKNKEEEFPLDNLKDLLASKPKDLNCKVGLITNGIRLLDEKVCKMVEWVRISLHPTNSLDFSGG